MHRKSYPKYIFPIKANNKRGTHFQDSSTIKATGNEQPRIFGQIKKTKISILTPFPFFLFFFNLKFSTRYRSPLSILIANQAPLPPFVPHFQPNGSLGTTWENETINEREETNRERILAGLCQGLFAEEPDESETLLVYAIRRSRGESRRKPSKGCVLRHDTTLTKEWKRQ